jgi:hypothetical protein
MILEACWGHSGPGQSVMWGEKQAACSK